MIFFGHLSCVVGSVASSVKAETSKFWFWLVFLCLFDSSGDAQEEGLNTDCFRRLDDVFQCVDDTVGFYPHYSVAMAWGSGSTSAMQVK